MNKVLSALRRGGEGTETLLRGRIALHPGTGSLHLVHKEKPEAHTGVWDYWSLVYLRRFHGEAYTLPLGYLLSKSAVSISASVARDKVYGLLGVADGQAAAEMNDRIDYKSNPKRMFGRMLLLLI